MLHGSKKNKKKNKKKLCVHFTRAGKNLNQPNWASRKKTLALSPDILKVQLSLQCVYVKIVSSSIKLK